MGLRRDELAAMSLGEFEDQVKAWNAAQSGDAAPLNDDEAEELAEMIDRFEIAGHA